MSPLLTVPLYGLGIPDVDVAAADADVAVREVEDAWRGPGADHGAALRVGPAVAAADVDRPAVGRHRDAVRLAGVREVAARPVDEALALVVGRDRRLAAGADHARAPLDRAEQVGAEVGLPVAGGRPAHAGVEGAPALEVAAPGDRPVGATDGGAVAGGGVRGVVARDGVHLAGRAASATGTRRRCAATRAGGPWSRDGRGRRPRRPAGSCRSGCPQPAGRRSGCRRTCSPAPPRRRRRCRRTRRRSGCTPGVRSPARRSAGRRSCPGRRWPGTGSRLPAVKSAASCAGLDRRSRCRRRAPRSPRRRR